MKKGTQKKTKLQKVLENSNHFQLIGSVELQVQRMFKTFSRERCQKYGNGYFGKPTTLKGFLGIEKRAWRDNEERVVVSMRKSYHLIRKDNIMNLLTDYKERPLSVMSCSFKRIDN